MVATRGRVILIASAALLLVSSLPASTATLQDDPVDARGPTISASLEPRPSILIEGDEDLDQPTQVSGVRSGSGTLEDPYVISNWTIATTQPYAIRLTGTSAHVVIEDIWLPSIGAGQDVNPFWGIHVHQSSNVTIQRVLINEATGVGVEFEASTHSTLRDSRLANTATDRVRTINNGFLADDSTEVLVENVTVETAGQAGSIVDASNVEIRQSTLWPDPGTASSSPSSLWVVRSSDVAIVRNELLASSLQLFQSGGQLTVARNAFLAQAPGGGSTVSAEAPRAPIAIGGHHDGPIGICGNRFDGHRGYAVSLDLLEGGRIAGNAFDHGGLSFRVDTSNVARVEDNLFEGNAGGTLEMWTGFSYKGRAEVHGNVFEDNEAAVSVWGEMDATGNWWGASDGPNVSGQAPNGSGQAIVVESGGELVVRPWLEDPPAVGPSSITCPVPPGPVGAQQGPGLTFRAHVDAHGAIELGPVPFPSSDQRQVPRPSS